MASRGTCTLLRDICAVLAGLPWTAGWAGDRERKSGLPGTEARFWALAWLRAGETGRAPWMRDAAEGELDPAAGGGTTVGPRKLPIDVPLENVESHTIYSTLFNIVKYLQIATNKVVNILL